MLDAPGSSLRGLLSYCASQHLTRRPEAHGCSSLCAFFSETAMLHAFLLYLIVLSQFMSLSLPFCDSVSFSPSSTCLPICVSLCVHMHLPVYVYVYISFHTLEYGGLCFVLRIYLYNRFKVMVVLKSGSPNVNQHCS